ncbi:MAG: ferrous iron transport protein B [Clostridiales Family XIII bacterium]|jgi:ferrous iron transport protein B|nr:ferrous iron transport protein B [Clostridiales Family XIII bacterium]
MTKIIALAGNPNSGKTTMFNDLTGSTQHTGNWPGVTVEKKEGRLKGRRDVTVQDLPGIYSLSPYSPEELVARNYLVKERPDVIVNIVDATNIERNLYLTTQLAELGIPVVIALNMIDIVNKNGDLIDIRQLGEALGCAVVPTSALKGTGLEKAAETALSCSGKPPLSPRPIFSGDVEGALAEIGSLLSERRKERGETPLTATELRWSSIKVFERDAEQTANPDTLLGAGAAARIEEIIRALEDRYDDDSESIITNERYLFIAGVVRECVQKKNRHTLSASDKIDRVVTNRVLALPIFAGVMFLVYFLSISTIGGYMTDWVNDSLFGDIVPNAVGGLLDSLGTAEWLNALILDGIIAGVGAVLGFLPQMLVLFLCLAFLEDCGYMARIAFILDRVFKRFGLSGKSFIPILVGTGCGVPGIMASRTIESDNDRRMTVMTTTFIPCGAKLPIIALIAGALFPGSMWIAPSAYFLGIAAILITGVMLKKTRGFAGKPSPFVMELPAYHMPGAPGVLRTMLDRGLAFVKRAGTIILIAAIVIWFLSSFDFSLRMAETSDSILAAIGGAVAPIFDPLGWGDWRATVATVTGLIAKENIVGTFGVLYGFGEVAEDGAEYWPQLAAAFTPLAAYAFLAFNLLCAPCFAAIGAIRREMMSAKWTWFAVGYQCGFAYVVALIIYQMGMLASGHFGVGTVFAILCILVIVYMLFIKKPYAGADAKNTQRLAAAAAAAE